MTYTFSERERATVLAALSYFRWHAADLETEPEFFTEHAPLTSEELVQLCERLNDYATLSLER